MSTVDTAPRRRWLAYALCTVALWGVWMVGGVWWPLGLVLAVAGVSGAVVGLVMERRR